MKDAQQVSEGMSHAWYRLADASPEATMAFEEIARFLARPGACMPRPSFAEFGS